MAGEHVPRKGIPTKEKSTNYSWVPELLKLGEKSGCFLYTLYMAKNEHELLSGRECQSLPSKYREGAEPGELS